VTLNSKNQLKQEQLEAFYESKFVSKSIPESYSSPHLISLGSGKINTDVMFVGQETNSWYYNQKRFLEYENSVKTQMHLYDEYLLEHYKAAHNLFWRYIKNAMNNDDDEIPVWNNLFKFDRGDDCEGARNISKASGAELKDIQEFHKGILAKEIEILQPKIIIFLTGHTYDKLYFDPIIKGDKDWKKLYRKVDNLYNQDNRLDEWKCADIGLHNFEGFENFKGKAIRTYHPRYLNTCDFKFVIIDYLKKEIALHR
jgi:hypothetical protein